MKRYCSTKGTMTKKSKVRKLIPPTNPKIHVTQKHQDVYRSVIEGRAVLRVSSDRVFYNPVQEFNRDLSILVLNVFTEDYKKESIEKAKKKNARKGLNVDSDEEEKVDITILEALSATGLRSIRYAKEVVNIDSIIANDISEDAVKTIKDNIYFNNVDHIVETSLSDATVLMHQHKSPKKRFTAIDLDPYGCPSQFLDSAVQSVAEGGLLLVTATDMAVLAGNAPEACYSKYGAISLKTRCCHEMSLRILLQCIEHHANRYSRYIVPLLSVSVDFYVRVFVKIMSGAIHCKKTTSKLAMVYRCVGCDSTTLQPLGAFKPNPTPDKPDQMKPVLPTAPPVGKFCDICNSKHQMGGPIWAGPLHDVEFVTRALTLVERTSTVYNTARRMRGVLAVVCEELATPLYHTLDKLCGVVHSGSIPMLLLRSAIMNAGFKVSYSHANKLSVKTDAPNRLVWDVVRTWASAQTGAKTQNHPDPIARYILSQAITYEVNLKLRVDANPKSRMLGHRRYQANPAPNWGPGVKSTVNLQGDKMLKSKRNQNKSLKGKNPKRRHSPTEIDEARKKAATKQLSIETASDGGDEKETSDGLAAKVNYDSSANNDNETTEADDSNNETQTEPDTADSTKTQTDAPVSPDSAEEKSICQTESGDEKQ